MPLLAALHDQVLAEPDRALAGWYATAVGQPRTDDVCAALRRHCHAHEVAIRQTVGSRSPQTNAVGRCGSLVPALGIVAADALASTTDTRCTGLSPAMVSPEPVGPMSVFASARARRHRG